jgi:DNA-binding beta-propeller fold protein YncE
MASTSLFQKPLVVATLQTGSDVPRRLTCFGSSKAWVSGIDDAIEGYDLKADFPVTELLNTKSGRRPTDLGVDPSGSLVYSDHYRRKILRWKNEHFKKVLCFRKWRPSGICCTSAGDLLVGLSNKDYSEKKIRRYKGRKVRQEIQFDPSGNPFFQPGDLAIFVQENNNDNICVSDCQAKRVSVFNKSGSFRFKYSGGHVMAEFRPGCLAIDSLCHILVSDTGNDLIHVLDINGQLLTYLDSTCGVTGIYGIAVDCENRVWVAECHTAKIKIINYL